MEGFLSKAIIGVGFSVLFIIVMAAVSLIGAIPTYFLWNWLMPDIFGLTTIGFWQAWGIFWLAGILIKSSTSISK